MDEGLAGEKGGVEKGGVEKECTKPILTYNLVTVVGRSWRNWLEMHTGVL